MAEVLQRYAGDAEFQPELYELGAVADGAPELPLEAGQLVRHPAAARYVAALDALIERSGLARLPGAREAVHRWCVARRDLGADTWRVKHLPSCVYAAGAVLTERVQIEDEWDVLLESADDARARIDAKVTAQLEEGRRHARELGVPLGRGRANRERDIGWLYLHLRGQTFGEIAPGAIRAREVTALEIPQAERQIRQAVNELAQIIGIESRRVGKT